MVQTGSGPADRIGPSEEQRARVRILLVEDEPAVAETTAEMLKHLGHEVITANLPSQALAMAERSNASAAAGGPGFDLVISDITMPEMNGHQLADRLRRLWPQVPVLFMTGYDSHMAEAGASAPFIPKPLSLRALADGIAKMLTGSHPA